MRLILRSKQWNYTQKSKKNNKIRIFIFFILKTMAKPQRRKHIKKLPEKNTKKADTLEQLEKIGNSLEASPEEQIKNLKRSINLLNIQIDCLISRSWKIGEELQELKRGKSRIVIFAIICFWLFLLDRASKSTTEETFIFQFVVGIGLITVAVYEAMRD